jgi:hypothetical protein
MVPPVFMSFYYLPEMVEITAVTQIAFAGIMGFCLFDVIEREMEQW